MGKVTDSVRPGELNQREKEVKEFVNKCKSKKVGTGGKNDNK